MMALTCRIVVLLGVAWLVVLPVNAQTRPTVPPVQGSITPTPTPSIAPLVDSAGKNRGPDKDGKMLLPAEKIPQKAPATPDQPKPGPYAPSYPLKEGAK